MKYRQLTQGERYTIKTLKQASYGNAAIARLLGRHKSTIGRELRRNRSDSGRYSAIRAQKKCESRRYAAHPIKFNDSLREVVKEKLCLDWSPDQISGWLRLHSPKWISHERIYQFVAEDKLLGGTLWTHLRINNRPHRRRRVKGPVRTRIRNRVPIDQRPAVVDAKTRIGDWEGDTMRGRLGSKDVLVTLVERKSKYLLVAKTSSRETKKVCQAICKIVKPMKNIFHTLTVDNGLEFAMHGLISKKLDSDVFFAHPYHSWERGLNENTNGLLRQYFPKKITMSTVSAQELLRAQQLLNHRPRRTLGYMTPHEALKKEIKRKKRKVALVT